MAEVPNLPVQSEIYEMMRTWDTNAIILLTRDYIIVAKLLQNKCDTVTYMLLQ
jgi:hypothetical protein